MPRTRIQASDGLAIEIWSATNAHIASIFNSAGTLKIDGNTQLDFTFSGSIRASILSGGSFKTFDGLSTGSTTGFFYLGSVAGTPSGVATTYSGLVPLVYDSTNDRLYVYNSSWKVVGGGITTLNTLTAATQTFADVDDTNVTLAISSVTSTHTFTMGWAGQLSIARGGTNASSFSVSGGLVYYNGTSLINSSNFVTDGTDVALGTSVSGTYKFQISRSDAVTTTKYGLYVNNASTSSTASITKYGVYVNVSGNWSGSSSQSAGIVVLSSPSSCPTVYGMNVAAQDGTSLTYGIRVSADSASGTTYSLYVEGGSNPDYSIYVALGDCSFLDSYFRSELITNTALTTGSTSGFFRLSSVAGTPTGALTTIGATVGMVYDSTNNKLYVYNGAWKSVTLT